MKKRIVYFFMMVILAAISFAQQTTITWQGKLLPEWQAVFPNDCKMLDNFKTLRHLTPELAAGRGGLLLPC